MESPVGDDDVTNENNDTSGDFSLPLAQQLEEAQQTIGFLQIQLAEALEFSEHNAILQKENAKLKSEIRTILAEKDNIEKRFEILSKLHEETVSKLQKQENVRIPLHLEMSEKIKSLHKELELATAKNEQLKLEIENINEARGKESAEYEMKLQNILKSAQKFFDQSYVDYEMLTKYLNTQNERSIRESAIAESRLDERRQMEVEKLRKKNKELKKAITDREQSIDNMSENHANSLIKLEQENSVLKNKIIEELHKNQLLDIRLSQEKNNYELQITELKNQLNNLKDVMKDLQDKNKENMINSNFSQENEELYERLRQSQKQNQELTYIISSLKKQVQTYQTSQSESIGETINAKISNLHDEKIRLCSELNEVKSKLSAFEVENMSLKEKLSTSQQVIRSAEISQMQKQDALLELDVKIEQQKQALEIISEHMQNQKIEFETLFTERDRVISLLYKMSRLNNFLSAESSKLREENSKLTFVNEKFEIRKPQSSNIHESIPVTSWFSSTFPKELCDIIADYAKNDALPVTAKLKQVLNSIGNYYNRRLGDVTEQSKLLDGTNTELVQNVTDFLSSFGTSLREEKLTIDDIMNPKKAKYIVDNVAKLKNDSIESASKAREIESSVRSILLKLETDNPEEADAALDDILQNLDELNQKNKKNTIVVRKQRKLIKKLEEDLIHVCQDKNDSMNTTEQKIESMQKDIKNLTSELYNSQTDNTKLKGQVEMLTASLENTERRYETNIEEERAKFRLQLNEIQIAQEKEIKKYKQAISTLDLEKAQAERDIDEWKKSCELIKESKILLEQEIDSLNQQLLDKELLYKENVEKQKEVVREQYDQLLNQLRDKNSELSELHYRVTESLNEAEERNREITTRNGELSSAAESANLRLRAYKDEVERERRINETKYKANILSVETKCQSKIEDLITEFKLEKSKLFGFAASSFSNFYDIGRELSDDSYRELILKIKFELDRLSEQDVAIRRLLGLAPDESPTQVLSKLLLSLYNN